MRVFDCFPFWREAWAIELRLRLWAEFAPQVDYIPVAFVGDRDHRGNPLPDVAVDPRCRVVRVTLDAEGNWGREMQQRDAILSLRSHFRPDDMILLCDADEIVNPMRLDQIAERCNTHHSYVKLAMAMYFFGTRWLFPTPWRHPGAFFARDMPVYPTAQVRMDTAHAAVGAAGWHLTYVGDLASKLKAFAHEEMDTEETFRTLQQAMTTGKLGTYKLLDIPIQGRVGDLFREIVG